MRAALFALSLLATAADAAGAGDARSRAEALAAQAAGLPGEAGVDAARRALALTADFDPTAFVAAGRKGEVVDDAFVEARQAYRAHRALLYRAWGRALLSAGRPLPASRALRRAQELAASPEGATLLARALLARGRGWEALDVALSVAGATDVAAEAADLLGLPSLQAEYDRRRLLAPAEAGPPAPRPKPRRGPFPLPPGTKLSTGARPRLDAGLALVYVAPRGCASCSRDVEDLARAAVPGLVIHVAAFRPDEDQALRQALRLYRRDWPVLYGADVAAALEIPGGAALLIAREGWSGALLEVPFRASLPAAAAALQATDVAEARPRPAWNRRPVAPPLAERQPQPVAGGLLPGEEEPAPPEWALLVAAFEAGRPRDALRALEALEARDDAWLLPPEARANRARLLAVLGRGDESRRLLLGTGDSRFQAEIDALLEPAAGRR